MGSLLKTLRAVHEDESGHAAPGFMSLVAAIGAIVLGIAVAADSDIAAIIGGVVLGLGLLAASVLSHMTIDYDIFGRLEKLEKK
jgi:hypothetical protein